MPEPPKSMTAGLGPRDGGSEAGSRGELRADGKTVAKLHRISTFEVGSGDKRYGRALIPNHFSGWLVSGAVTPNQVCVLRTSTGDVYKVRVISVRNEPMIEMGKKVSPTVVRGVIASL
jgi:hypothetical protein